MFAPPPTIEMPSFCPEIMPALLNVPPPLASMPLDCRLTMLAPAVLFNVAAFDRNAPRPPGPRAVIEPVFVTTPVVGSSETIPCEFEPDTSIVPCSSAHCCPRRPPRCRWRRVRTHPVPLVVIEPLFASVSLFVSAAMPDAPSPDVLSTPLFVSEPPPAREKSSIAFESAPLVWMTPEVSLSSFPARLWLYRPSDCAPPVWIRPRLVNWF